jgi:nucleoid-associated protein YgaU
VAAVVTIVAVAVASLFWLFVAGRAEASNHPGPGGPGSQGVVRVVVRPGQTLWEIALRVQPMADPRAVIQEIVDANSLTGPGIQVGEVLWVPQG